MNEVDWRESDISNDKPHPPEEHDIDIINDETFGDNITDVDWETVHTSSLSVTLQDKVSSDVDKTPDDLICNGDKDKNTSENVRIDKISSQFDDLGLKDIWESSPQQSSPLHSIWSSPTLPHPSAPSKPKSPSQIPKGQVMTLEDLERELIDSTPSSSSSSSPTRQPSVQNVQLKHPSPSPSPPAQPPMSIHQFHHPILTRPTVPYPSPPPGLGFPMARSHPQHRSPLLPQPFMSPYFVRGPSPHSSGLPPHLLPNIPLMGPPRLIRGPYPPPFGFNMPPPLHPIHPFVQLHLMHGHAPPHQIQQTPPRIRPTSSKLNEMLSDLQPDGRGFMSTKEKEWVIKVQLIQLHSLTPEIDDYYYQQYIQKRYHKSNKEEGLVAISDSHTPLTLPPPVTREEKKKTHADFEGTLGKVSVGSVTAPRKVIDIAPPTSNEGKKEGGNKRRHLLSTIEEMYSLILELDELESHTSSISMDSEEVESNKRKKFEIQERLFAMTRVNKETGSPSTREGDQLFLQLLYYRKGKRLFQRLLPFLNENQSKLILLSFSKYLANIIKKDSQDKVLPDLIPCIRGVIVTCQLAEVMNFLKTLQPLFSSKFVDNLFFIEFVTILVNRGQSILSSDTNEHQSTQWSSLLSQLNSSFKTSKAKLNTLESLLTTPIIK